MAVFFALQAFSTYLAGESVMIRSDNSTAVSVIAKKGSMNNYVRNALSVVVWDFAYKNDIFLSISHIPGVLNPADGPSRCLTKYTEWTLPSFWFKKIIAFAGKPKMDLFASRLNHRLPTFVSWLPDPYCFKVDAFSFWWSDYYYAFPPFVLLLRVISKIQEDEATILLVFPYWTAQVWFPRLLHMLISPLYFLPREVQLYLPWDRKLIHPLQDKLQLVSAKISGDSIRIKDFRRQYQLSSCLDIEKVPSITIK